MITTGAQLKTFLEQLNGDQTIDTDLADTLVDTAKTILEGERPWLNLRKTNTSKTVTTSNTWQTAIDLSTITDFSEFFSDTPIRLFDGSDRVEYYRLVPIDRRLEYKDISNTACYDYNAKVLYLNGTVPFSGTLYISHLTTSTAIDTTSTSAVWTVFPPRYLPLLAYYAIGIYQGGIDYDSISARQAPNNLSIMQTLKKSMEKWDDNLQQSDLETNDPTDLFGYPRSGAIDRYKNN